MFVDPQNLTIATVPTDLSRISSYPDGVFMTPDGKYKLRMTHNLRQRSRRSVRLEFTDVVADPFITGTSRPASFSIQFSIDHPKVGFENQELTDAASVLLGWLNTAGNIDKLIGGES